jgi:hypothetical protein
MNERDYYYLLRRGGGSMLAWLSKQNTLEGGTINFQADNE